MKAPIRVDAKSGLVHTVGITTASNHDNSVMDKLLREDDRAGFGDKAYASDKTKRAASGSLLGGAGKARRHRSLSASQSNKKHAT